MIDQSMIVTGGFFAFIFISGFWVSRSGRPYPTGIFTVHKLIGLALGVFLIRTVMQTHQVSPLTAGQMAAIAITVILFIAAVAAGGLLSAKDGLPRAVTFLHRSMPYLIVLSTGLTLYMLLFPRS